MNSDLIDRIVEAVLYEGYMLYPYRASVKNRHRWTFGGIYPRAYSEAMRGAEPCLMRTECLFTGDPATVLDVNVRFLHLIQRRIGRAALRAGGNGQLGWEWVDSLQVGDTCHRSWQEAME